MLGDISIGIKCAPGVVGPAEADIDFDIIKNDNDTFTVKYTPPGAGRYTIMVLFADQVIKENHSSRQKYTTGAIVLREPFTSQFFCHVLTPPPHPHASVDFLHFRKSL